MIVHDELLQLSDLLCDTFFEMKIKLSTEIEKKKKNKTNYKLFFLINLGFQQLRSANTL